ncbi:hypothetical protein SAMN05421543_109104 [Alicyclobacillus macrosporangiidus]|uniref:Uncharacterized protein n=1 Tax=Alicyclobacillus macrosporangiidus TaxID=392015 RepID=A0A1I7JC91_9BACL|nr:hypothetical protein SAMN05421543_109104 [Alicyclobacillus macrosporangiidus]
MWTATAGALLALATGGCGQAANHTANAVNATGNAAGLAARGTANVIRGAGNAVTDATRLGPAGDRNAWTRHPFTAAGVPVASQSVEVDPGTRTVNIRLAGTTRTDGVAPGTRAGAAVPGAVTPGAAVAPGTAAAPGRPALAPTVTVPTGWTVRVTAPAASAWNHGLAVVPYRDGTAPVGAAAARTPGVSRALNFRANHAGLYALVVTTPGQADRVIDILNVSNGNRTPAVLTYQDGWR